MSAKKSTNKVKTKSSKQDNTPVKHHKKKHKHSIKFHGNYLVLALLFILGIFLPPVMSMAVLYFAQRTFPKKPKIIDRNIFIFAITLFSIWFAFTLMIGDEVSVGLEKAIVGSIFVLVVVYPFVYAWLYFDWNYRIHNERLMKKSQH